MQTFLPLPSFHDSMRCLDYRRLGKQRVETRQILDILRGRAKSNAWKNHPAVRMWRGHEEVLNLYLFYAIEEWKRRGYVNNMVCDDIMPSSTTYPDWFGDDKFHSSHRAALLAKDFHFYKQFSWPETPSINYWWPV